MQLCINDAAYNGQFASLEEAKSALLCHVQNISATEGIRAHNNVLRTKELKNKRLTKDNTIYDLFLVLQKSKIPEDRKLLSRLLIGFIKGPFIDMSTLEGEYSLNGADISYSALAYCVSSPCTQGVISPNLKGMKSDLSVTCSKSQIVIKNYYSLEQIELATWKYESNPKHEIPKDIIVNGNVWTKMALSDDQAQALLSRSIKIHSRRCSFAKYGEQWYQFYNHEANQFHGFPIANPGNDGDLNHVMRFLSEHDCTCCGQLIIN